MFIEALIDGEVLTREEVSDVYLQDIPGASWQQNVEARRQVVEYFLEELQKKMERVFFERRRDVIYVFVLQSKLNTYGADEGTDIPADAAAKGGYPENAEGGDHYS